MTHALDQADRLAAYRPSGHLLMVMLRASAVDDGKGGPWLSITRTRTAPRVYVHHIGVTAPTAYSQDRVVMCSGVELLGKFCSITRGVPANIIRPGRDELRELGDWCCERVRVELWDADVTEWARWYLGPRAKDRREAELANAESRVRSLRWLMAEEWLR